MLLNFYKKSGETFNHTVSLPEESPQGLPMIVFLHGADERGSDLARIRRYGIPHRYDRLQTMPVITLSPQCESGKVWVTQVDALMALIDTAAKRFGADRSRIALTGMSMGGFGAWELATDFPNAFSCLVPLCGGGSPWRAELLKNLPIRAFHGEQDAIIKCFYSQDMVEAVNAAGGHAELTIYPDLRHDCWTRTYADDGLIGWMMEQRRKG